MKIDPKLTKEQEACVQRADQEKDSRILLIRGYAGSGKSLVLGAIAKKYSASYQTGEKRKIGLFTFQNTLVSVFRENLELSDDKDSVIVAETLDGYLRQVYKAMEEAGKVPKRSFPWRNAEETRLKNVEAALKQHRKEHGKHRFHDLDVKFWRDEFDWMKEQNVWLGDQEYYLTLERKGRGSAVRMRQVERYRAYEMFETYCKYLEKTGQADWMDQALYISRHKEDIPDEMKFEHVLVDEAQDFSLAQMKAVLCLYTKDLAIAMDGNQKIHKKTWKAKQLGADVAVKRLSKPMRTTRQIDELAESIRKNNDPFVSEEEKTIRTLSEREGEKPVLAHLESLEAEKTYVLQLIKDDFNASKDITIGIIAGKKELSKTYSRWLAGEGIPFEIISRDTTFSAGTPGVKIVGAFAAKGLEFDAVIIPLFTQGNFPYAYKSTDPEEVETFLHQMRSLLYVAMTRAKTQLTITYSGNKGSQFIGEMDRNLLNLQGASVEGSYVLQETAGTDEETIKKEIPWDKSAGETETLAGWLKAQGVDFKDSRESNGTLWIFGEPEKLEPVMTESKKKFRALWSQSVGKKGWFTRCRK